MAEELRDVRMMQLVAKQFFAHHPLERIMVDVKRFHDNCFAIVADACRAPERTLKTLQTPEQKHCIYDCEQSPNVHLNAPRR